MSFFQSYVANANQLVRVDQATSGANAAVAITLAGTARKRQYAVEVLWSYDDTPTTGRLTISGLDTTSDTIDFDIRGAGPGPLFLPPIAGALGTDVIITLAAGGAGVIGKLTVMSVLLDGWA